MVITFLLLDKENIINGYSMRPYNFHDTYDFREILKEMHIEGRAICPIQTHTNHVEVLTEENVNQKFLDTDGLITNLKDVTLITKSADCESILLYDKEKQVIGNIHSGWRGTLNKIIDNAIHLMEKTFNCNPKDIIAVISPSIGKCCFEVEKDVVDMFLNQFDFIDDLIEDKKNGKYYIDLKELNHRELLHLGLLDENIEISNICTKCNSDEYYSYRAEKENCGRNIALICMKSV